MAVEGCYKCVKFLLVAFNILVLLVGGAVLALGIYIMVSDYGVTKISVILGSDDLYEVGVILLIVIGSITILVSFCGCCGAWMENRCLLGTYFGIMLLITIFYTVICVVGFIFRENITGQLKLEAETALINKYGMSKDKDVTERWDTVQQELECCGMTGDASSNTSWAIYKLQTLWFKDRDYSDSDLGIKYVPFSCCNPSSNLERCVGRLPSGGINGPPVQGPPITSSMEVNDGLYTDGCYDKLESFLDENASIIGGIALGALIVMVLGVIFSVCLCSHIGQKGYVV